MVFVVAAACSLRWLHTVVDAGSWQKLTVECVGRCTSPGMKDRGPKHEDFFGKEGFAGEASCGHASSNRSSTSVA